MTTIDNPKPDATVHSGDDVLVETKNPFTSTALWGLVLMLATWAAKRWVPPFFQDQTMKAFVEVSSMFVGGALVLYGRWRAARPLGWADYKRIIVPLFLISCVVSMAGCSAFGLESIAQREAMLKVIGTAETSISSEHLGWAASIANEPGAKAIPDLSAYPPAARHAWYVARQKRYDELQRALGTMIASPPVEVPVLPTAPAAPPAPAELPVIIPD